MDMATPPLALPSSFVMPTPVILTAFENTSAWITAFCPVVASMMRSDWQNADGASLSMTLRILDSSSIRFCLLCRRPAVSIISTSTFLARAA